MNLDELQKNRYIRNFFKDQWLIFGSTAVVLFFSLIYLGFVHKPSYESEAKVWIKDTSTASYLSENPNMSSYLRPLTSAGNPVMTQVKILTSHEMEDYLAKYAVQQQQQAAAGQKSEKPAKIEEPSTRKIIKVKTEPNNDVIDVKLKWTDPVMARQMLNAALARLDAVNLDINRQIHTKKRQYLDTQLAEIEAKLLAVRNQIKDFQSGTLAVDVDAQTEELVRLRTQLLAQLESVVAARNNNATNAMALQGQLAMAPREALNAVALGSGNENLVKLRSDLALLKQQYAHDSVKEAPTNPHLVALKKQIDALESEIAREVRETTGGSGGGRRIYDNVRGQLVQDLASSRARSAGLGSEAASLQAAIARVDGALKSIPESRFALVNLQEEEKALSQAYDELRQKQIDASIKEAETPSNVFVVDAPTMPEKASFPASKHILVLSALLGLMAGMGVSAFKTYTEDLCEGPEAVEEATRSKVLGIVPWLRLPMPSQVGEGKVLSINDVAIKNIISNLRIEAAKHHASVLTFTSSSFNKPQVSTAYNLAQRLSRLGHSVAVIDADCRPSSLVNFVENPAGSQDLTDLILSVDMKLRKGMAVYPEDIFSGLMMDANGVYLGLNRRDVDHAYDYFACRGFKHMIEVLKSQFDWVFIDTPSATIAPEFMAISNLSDGVVLFADRKATFSDLRRIAHKIRETEVPLIGTIMREKNQKLEREHREYANWRNTWRGGGGGALAPTATTVAVGNTKRVEFMGAKIDALSMRETVDRICEIIDSRQRVQHVVVNVAKLMTMRHDPELREIVNSSGLINADGAGVVLGARMLGVDIPERVAGIDLMQELVETSNKQGYRVFFLGAEEDVVRDVVTIYKRRYPSLQICGYRNGYFSPEDELAVAHQIRNAKPDILLVAMSSPKKEKFIREYQDMMDVPFVMGVGGSFDVVAGKVSRAPMWMQNAGMEWVYRLIQEPRRMWKRYLVTNIEFGWALANAKMRTANG